MGNLNNLISSIQFPGGGNFLEVIVFGLLRFMYDIAGSYGIAIILFTILMRTIMVPLDFANKYFTKKNAVKMAEMKPELDKVAKAYAGDPLGKNRATQAVYRRNGHSMGGFCFFMFVNLAFTLVLFITVFGCLNMLSNYNVNHQFKELQAVYNQHLQSTYNEFNPEHPDWNLTHDQNSPEFAAARQAIIDSDEFRAAILARHNETRVSFLWVNNMWRPDNWSSRTLEWNAFNSARNQVNSAERAVTTQEQYNAIMGIVNSDSRNRGWNGLFILIVLAGVTTYFSAVINAKAMQKRIDEKKAKEEEQEVAKYSIRDTMETGDGDKPLPQIDPAMMGKMMKIVLPLIMVVFTFISTAALALYITIGAIMTTGYSFLTSAVADKILKKQEDKKKEEGPGNIINPHAKYFKRKSK